MSTLDECKRLNIDSFHGSRVDREFAHARRGVSAQTKQHGRRAIVVTDHTARVRSHGKQPVKINDIFIVARSSADCINHEGN